MEKENRLRTLYIAKILFEQTDEDHFLTTEQIRSILMEEYGIDVYRQTVSKDVKILNDFGMKIEVEHSSQNRYYIEQRYLDMSELKLLIDAVMSSKSISSAQSKKLAAKLAVLTGKHKADELKRNICVEGRVKGGNEKLNLIINDINYAINNKLKISFCYFTYDAGKKKVKRNNGEPYVFSPYNMVWNGDCYYVVGYSDKHDRIAQFRLDRFASSPNILQDKAVPKPKDYNINEKLNCTFHMFDAKHETVELICDNNVMDSIIDKFGTGVATENISNSQFRATVKVAVSHIFYSWIFGFGGKVRIEGPEDIRQKYSELLQKAMDNR